MWAAATWPRTQSCCTVAAGWLQCPALPPSRARAQDDGPNNSAARALAKLERKETNLLTGYESHALNKKLPGSKKQYEKCPWVCVGEGGGISHHGMWSQCKRVAMSNHYKNKSIGVSKLRSLKACVQCDVMGVASPDSNAMMAEVLLPRQRATYWGDAWPSLWKLSIISTPHVAPGAKIIPGSAGCTEWNMEDVCKWLYRTEHVCKYVCKPFALDPYNPADLRKPQSE